MGVKVLFDHQAFSMQKYGGVSRYFCEIMNYFYNNPDMVKIIFPRIISNNYYIKNAPFYSSVQVFKGDSFFGEYKIYKLLDNINILKSRLYVKSDKYDVFHPTYYSEYFLDKIGNKPFVITVHDMIHEKFPQYFPKDDRTTEIKRLLVNKAARVIAISNNTKKDLIELFKVNDKKIDVVYHGNTIGADALEKEPSVCEIGLKYILFVGSRYGYKNFKIFIKSIAPVLREDDDLHLICAGGGAFSREETELLQSLGVYEKVKQRRVGDAEIVSLYKGALAFIFPSLYEGFGMPVLEAFTCKCPAVISNKSSFCEIAGDAAAYFDPNDMESIKETVKKVVYNSELRNKLIQRGYKRKDDFTWKEAAKKTYKTYKSL